MKYIKLFEGRKRTKPRVGDYVLCTTSDINRIDFINFINSTIGKITRLSKYSCDVKFEKPLNAVGYNNRDSFYFPLSEIEHFSVNRKDLEFILKARKYNL